MLCASMRVEPKMPREQKKNASWSESWSHQICRLAHFSGVNCDMVLVAVDIRGFWSQNRSFPGQPMFSPSSSAWRQCILGHNAFSFSISCVEFPDCRGRDGSERWPVQSEWSLWIRPEAQFHEGGWKNLWPWDAPETGRLQSGHAQHTGTKGKII